MGTDKTKMIGAIVARDYRAAGIFQKYGIDFCCGGKRTIDDVCQEKGIASDLVEADLATLSATVSTKAHDFASWSTPFLVDYILNKHHHYIRTIAPQISMYAEKVAMVHGEWRPETKVIALKWKQLVGELLEHMEIEEQDFFPDIRQEIKPATSFTGLEADHEQAGQLMADIRELSDDYTPPAGACTTYRVLYATLQEFEENLHEHVHLENNVLFTRVTEA
ncbi:MAG: iron-sulfur cluster repair di-iron protein [Lewinellaceae bacterium]|nr:iron-sulfur cluster repair di-iron protein [Lewinellaceae bacterium]